MAAVGGRKAQQQQHPPSSQFPASVSEILTQITLFVNAHGNKWSRVKAGDLQSRIDQDLFCLSPDRRSSKLNELQKLKLMGILCTYFSQPELRENRSLRHIHFDVIFCGREGETFLHEIRIGFLIKFSVMALQYPVYSLFEDIAQWLHKVASVKPYAERIVGELMDKFIEIPEHYKMYEYLLPLHGNALSFALFFLVHSIGDSVNGPLAIVLGEWLSADHKSYLELLRDCSYLAEKFASQKFDSLLRYDIENGRRDEIHDRFHYCVSVILIDWKATVIIDSKKSSTTSARLNCTSIVSIMSNFFNLPQHGQDRFLDNFENCLRAGHINIDDIRDRIPPDFASFLGFSTRFSSLLYSENEFY
ncbi:hypothetical protein Ddc_08076 [Ditylenchus destructor]|nr:hypothetical protein Ddc_08076 [Ditylenchus destructor]